MSYQQTFVKGKIFDVSPPTTRYQGSKNKIKDWIWSHILNLNFDSFLDAFSGTCVMGFEAKRRSKRTIVNDFLSINYEIGKAIIENCDITLEKKDLDFLLKEHDHINYPSVIQDEFKGKYYTEKENKWLDRVVTNIYDLENEYKRSIAFSSLSQACLVKRPYNLFHRANLNMRTRDVERSFGNKTTWEKPFPSLFKKFVKEFNNAVFDNGKKNLAFNKDVFDLDVNPDLAYFDPPYYSKKSGGTDYQFYYHFLEGMLDYQNWRDRIDRSVKTYRLNYEKSVWNQEDKIMDSFKNLFKKYQDSKIVLSYNTHGIPSVEKLTEMIGTYKEEVLVEFKDHKYVLSNHDDVEEVIIIGK